MTHSLHRVNDDDIKPKALEFTAVAEAVGSENWGDVKTGPKLRYSIEEIKDGITDKSRLRGIFTKKEQVVDFLKQIKKKDLGMSVIISGSYSGLPGEINLVSFSSKASNPSPVVAEMGSVCASRCS